MSEVTDAPATIQASTKAEPARGGFIWYELMSPDPAASKAFYDAVVGWDIESEPSGDMDYRMIRRADGGNAGGILTLSEDMQGGGARPTWLGYLGVDDVDASASAVEAGGGRILMPPRDIADGLRIAMVADPQGAPFYLMRTTSEGVSDVFSVGQPQHVRWNELWTSDAAGAVDFYKKHFGWEQEGSMPMGEMGDYRFVQAGGVAIGAIMPRMPDVPASMWNFYIGVDDIDRAAEAVKSGGGQVVNGPMEIPGGEYAVNAVDPHGAQVGFVGPRKH